MKMISVVAAVLVSFDLRFREVWLPFRDLPVCRMRLRVVALEPAEAESIVGVGHLQVDPGEGGGPRGVVGVDEVQIEEGLVVGGAGGGVDR